MFQVYSMLTPDGSPANLTFPSVQAVIPVVDGGRSRKMICCSLIKLTSC